MSERLRGVVLLTAAALAWSFGGIWIKLVSIHPMATAGMRSLIAGTIVLIYARGIQQAPTRRQWLGAIAYAGTVTLFVLATRASTAANAILLQYTAPIWVALASPWLLKEKIAAIDWGAIVLVVGGMVLLVIDRLVVGNIGGDIMAVASGICFAMGIIALRGESQGSPLTIIIIGNAITAVIGLPFLAEQLPSGNDLVYLLLLGSFQLALGYILFARGVRYVSALEGTLIPMLEPILNPLWVVLFYGEQPTTLAFIGGAIIIATVAARSMKGRDV